MGSYRYETHLHTNIVSACSGFTPEQIVEKYTRLGYAGIFVTDHFLNGNTTVPRDLPWEERISRFTEGYRAVKKFAESKLSVFFGLEYSYLGTDFLVYGLSEEWLIAHPEIMQMSTKEFCHYARKEGALVIQAHPFRGAEYIDHVRLFPNDVDGFEIFNGCGDDRSNDLAKITAEKYNLIPTAGTDIHHHDHVRMTGVEFSAPIESVAQFMQALKAGEGRIFSLNDELYLK